ncbi:uncharacterized protein LOC105421443 [Amborella trichopoda]|uniref:uncharacterized protein LOC105421443 n=1 Tax=Amborella trichopoda TaxID=13333 RepID=UPI0009C0340D|nr:uncharacterized protein LOC105421443 [Amborella trichopoda]|eukprot:XP_020529328.1 uncharacterized protein LOC105421443 [Amborella trichopoda]
MVTFIESGKKCICTCQFSERVEIPCSHMPKVFNMRNVLKIPSNYILSRWTMDAKKGIKDKCGASSLTISKFSSFIRHHELYDLVRTIVELVLKNDDLFEKVKLGFSKLVKEVNTTRESLSNTHVPLASTHCSAAEDEVCGSIRSIDASPFLLDPPCARAVGQPRTKRIKPSWKEGPKASTQKNSQRKRHPLEGIVKFTVRVDMTDVTVRATKDLKPS